MIINNLDKYPLKSLLGVDSAVWHSLRPIILPHLAAMLLSEILFFINDRLPDSVALPWTLVAGFPLALNIIVIIIYYLKLRHIRIQLNLSWPVQKNDQLICMRCLLSLAGVGVGLYYGQTVFGISKFFLIPLIYLGLIFLHYELTVLPWEIILYLVFGGLTTVVSVVSFTIFDHWLNGGSLNGGFDWTWPKLLSFVLAILFAYWTNRCYVFESKGAIPGEFFRFVVARVGSSLVFEGGGLYLLVNVLGLGKQVSNLAVSILVVIANYVLSKISVFKAERT